MTTAGTELITTNAPPQLLPIPTPDGTLWPAIPGQHNGNMTPAQQFSQYLTRTLGDLTIVATNTSAIPGTERLHTHLNRAAWRLLRYSSESEAGTSPELAPAVIQARAYRERLELALDEAALLLTETWESQPAEHATIGQAANRLIALYNTTIPTFPPLLAERAARLESRTPRQSTTAHTRAS